MESGQNYWFSWKMYRFKGIPNTWHLDFASAVWSPYKVKHIEQLESVQRRITKQLPGMQSLSYPERLHKLNLPTLSYRRLRGDLIETYKITNGMYDPDCSSCLKLWRDVTNSGQLRGHSKKLFLQRSRLQVRENAFAIRVVPTWNKLPEDVVSAPDINVFKNRLDDFMSNQDIMFNDYRADLNLWYLDSILNIESNVKGRKILNWKIK